MFKPIIEFCISNLASGSQRAREVLERDPNLDIIEYGCSRVLWEVCSKSFRIGEWRGCNG